MNESNMPPDVSRVEYATPKSETYYTHVNTHVLEAIPETASRILDVGCGAGGLAREIKRRNASAVVDGVELDPASAQLAKAVVDNLYCHDLNNGVPDSMATYDCIVCADVLEHLVDPWSALRSLVGRLERGGCLVVSLPNLRHYKVIRALCLRGEFEYTEDGIMDSTHLRFFTRKGMVALLESAGLRVEAIRPRVRGGNGLVRLFDWLFGGDLKEFRAVQYTITGIRRP